MCNHFCTAKLQLLESGEIAQRTYDDYFATCERLVKHFGRNRFVADLASDDFAAYRANIAKAWGPVALGNEVQRVRTTFKYAYDAGLVEQPMRYGPSFRRPNRKVMRLNRAEKGPKIFEAADIRRMIDAAGVQLKAMILLAVNCGFGNGDVGTLPLSALDLAGGWVNYHRPKTGISRRCALWPKTVKAVREAIASDSSRKRPKRRTWYL